jgi:hypothetical protein
MSGRQINVARETGTKPILAYELGQDRVKFYEATYSAGNGACVVVAQLQNDSFLVADSKKPWQKPLEFNTQEWEAFVASVKAGEFNSENIPASTAIKFRFFQTALWRLKQFILRPSLSM